MMHRQRIFPALRLIAAGVYFLLRNAGVIHGKTVHYVIAVALIMWGISKLLGRAD